MYINGTANSTFCQECKPNMYEDQTEVLAQTGPYHLMINMLYLENAMACPLASSACPSELVTTPLK